MIPFSHFEFKCSSNSLAVSLDFWQRMGFEKIVEAKSDVHFAILTDGQMRFSLIESAFTSPVLSFFADDLAECAHVLRQNEIIFQQGDLITFATPEHLPVTVSPTAKFGKFPMKAENFKLGKLGEITLPVDKLEDSSLFWRSLGFNIIEDQHLPYPWQVLENQFIRLGLHESQQHPSPCFTYLCADVTKAADEFAAAGIEPVFRIAAPGGKGEHAGFESPDGQIFYLFQWKKP